MSQEHQNKDCPADVSSRVSRLEPHYFAFGEVSDIYRCKLVSQDGSEREVAVKVMRGFTSGEFARKRFKKQLIDLIGRWQQLSHPNIMECYGICQDMGHLPGLVLPMCDSTIMEHLQAHPVTPKLDLLCQVASAVHYLHSARLVHADIRGASILMRKHSPLLMDSGLCPLISYGEFTVAGVYGRPRWMAPEILQPPDDLCSEDMEETIYTPETDIYALGMTILEVMTGKLPYSHRRYDTVVMLDVIQGIRPNRPRDPEISNDVWNIITACWEPKPHRRPSAALVDVWLNVARYAEVT